MMGWSGNMLPASLFLLNQSIKQERGGGYGWSAGKEEHLPDWAKERAEKMRKKEKDREVR